MTKHKIYVASSWRNEYYPEVVEKLREAGHNVYDFRNPPSGAPRFKRNCVSEGYMEWTPQLYRDMLHHSMGVRTDTKETGRNAGVDNFTLNLSPP